MIKYLIKSRLKSEAIFGSGESQPGTLDADVVVDEQGFPYMKSKTFKGNLRESMEEVVIVFNGLYKDELIAILGDANDGLNQSLRPKFSDFRISKAIRGPLIKMLEEKKITERELKEVLTGVRTFTSINDEGSYVEGSLRNIRVIQKGLIYEVLIESNRELTSKEKTLLTASIKNLNRIGSMKTRGKGEIDNSFFEKENEEWKDKTNYYLDYLHKEVNKND